MACNAGSSPFHNAPPSIPRLVREYFHSVDYGAPVTPCDLVLNGFVIALFGQWTQRFIWGFAVSPFCE